MRKLEIHCWKDDLAVMFRQNRVRLGVCWCLLANVLLWPTGHRRGILSALSTSPLECVRLNEWLDISPSTPHSLSLVQPFLHLPVIWFRFISPFAPRGSLPWLPQPGQCPLPRASYFPLLHCIIAISCSSFSFWSSNPTDGRKLTQEVFSSWPISVPCS